MKQQKQLLTRKSAYISTAQRKELQHSMEATQECGILKALHAERALCHGPWHQAGVL